jgi:spermidine synthase
MYFVFFLSGAAALIYEISWSRQIGLLFGHTVHAASIVLASYFLGLAIGYWIGGKLLEVNRKIRISPLVGYAVAEVVVAGWAFAIPILLTISESSSIVQILSSDSVAWQTTTRAIFSFILLMPATIALGVTLPMMADYFSKGGQAQTDSENPSSVSFAYALNTAGALIGVLLATFYLLINAGVAGSSYVAALVSLACAGLALIAARKLNTDFEIAPSTCSQASLGSTLGSSPNSTLVLFLSFISGFGTLALQVLYTRMFSLVFHNSTYTFGIVVAVFLGALALGAALAGWLQRKFDPVPVVAIASAAGGIAVASSIFVFIQSTQLNYFQSGSSFAAYMVSATALVSIVVGPSVVCLGMLLPLVWRIAGSDEIKKAGQTVGRLTAINTLAAAIGAIVASFLMLKFFGLWPSVLLIASLFALTGILIFWKLSNSRRVLWICGISLCFALSFSISCVRLSDSNLETVRDHERLVKRWNSTYGWIDVLQDDKGAFKIRQNLHYRFGKTGTNTREFKQTHLPLLIHPNPEKVLCLGMGTGLTAGAAITHKTVQQIDVVELIPEVVEAARMLTDENFNVVESPRTRIHIDDARHYLLATSQDFDVIISDLFVPWESGTGYLYTVDHYEVSKRRLSSDGIFCQWLPLYQLGEQEFEIIANSFASVFPQTTVWIGQFDSKQPVIALVGSVSPIQVDANQLVRRLSELETQLGSLDPTIGDHYIGDWQLNQSDNLILNTDEHPRVEFLNPISNRNQEMLRSNKFERYFEEAFSSSTSVGISINDQKVQSVERRRSAQRFMMFGR